jgi:hypothetical protein
MNNYVNEFPNYDGILPKIEGFIDSSYKNDICPSIEYEINKNYYLKVFCDFVDPLLRELGGFRFVVSVGDCDLELSILYSTESESELKAFIKGFLGYKQWNEGF